jgi:hypothetical protein
LCVGVYVNDYKGMFFCSFSEGIIRVGELAFAHLV